MNLGFIVGHYKSGSTWLLHLLSLHPQICGIAETNVFRYSGEETDTAKRTQRLYYNKGWGQAYMQARVRESLSKWTRPVRQYWKPALSVLSVDRPTTLLSLNIWQQLQLKRELRDCSSPDVYCQRFFQYLDQHLVPHQFLIEKTPANISYVPRIRETFPEAKLIAIYRDGRDVLVSDKAHLRNTYQQQQVFEDSLLTWKQSMELQLEYADRYGIHLLSYESLLQQGELEVENLLQFLNLQSNEEMIQDILHRSSFEFTTGRRGGEENPNSFYRKGIAGDWKTSLSIEEKDRFKELAGDTLIQLGYEKDSNW